MRILRAPLFRLGGAVAGFFAIKILIGLLLVAASAHQLSVTQFVTFSQLFLCLALLATISGGGVQGGLTRQIAVAGGNAMLERRALAAALTIWAGFAALLLAGTVLFGQALSVVLVGHSGLARPILFVTLTAILGGAGSLLTSVLTGRGRVLLSLTLQAAGLLASGAACYIWLLAGDPVGSVLAFAAGPLVTAVLALAFTHDVLPRPGRAVGGLITEARMLSAYSFAGLSMAVVMPATLFGLRHAYRVAFGAEQLGYWLAANRVSDVTSQLLGIYMGQIFLPRMARAVDFDAARRLSVQTFLLGSIVMGAGALVFVVGAPFFVETFFSHQFLPAIPFIAGYLLGDMLRVSASMAAHTAAARGRPWLCVGVELTVAALLSAYMLGLTALGRSEAPWLGYVLTQATITLVAIGAGGQWLRMRRRAGSLTPPAAVLDVQGSDVG